MSTMTMKFEEKCNELSKKVFSGHPVTKKEQDAHNIYWQYVQVTNRGFRPWLLDCEKGEAKNTLYSLHQVGLAQVADLTEQAIDLLSASVLADDEDAEEDTGKVPLDPSQNIANFTAIDQQYVELKADIELAVERYLG